MVPGRRVANVIVVGFVIGALLNVLFEARLPQSVRGLDRSTSGDLAVLAVETQRTVRIRYSFHAALHDEVRGGVLVIHDPGAVGAYEVENFAYMAIQVEDFDPRVTAELADRLLDLAIVQGDGALQPAGDEVPFAIVAERDVPSGTRFRLLFHETRAFVVDERTLERLAS